MGAALGLGLLPGCWSEPVDPSEATLNVSLVTPNSDDGAVLFTLSGGPVDSIEAVGYSVYSARIEANAIRVIITGTLAPGPVARIHIPDHRQISGYSAVVNQVAARTTYQQRDPSGYSLTVAP
jgi:hypothetical protein